VRVVLDTNVIVSAIISPGGPPDRIFRAWRRGSYELITSAPLLEELAEVLVRPRIRHRTGFSSREEAAFVAELRESAVVVAPTRHLTVVSDPDDNRILEAATTARADYLVSGDDQVLSLESFEQTRIVTPSRFLAILNEAERSQ